MAPITQRKLTDAEEGAFGAALERLFDHVRESKNPRVLEILHGVSRALLEVPAEGRAYALGLVTEWLDKNGAKYLNRGLINLLRVILMTGEETLKDVADEEKLKLAPDGKRPFVEALMGRARIAVSLDGGKLMASLLVSYPERVRVFLVVLYTLACRVIGPLKNGYELDAVGPDAIRKSIIEIVFRENEADACEILKNAPMMIGETPIKRFLTMTPESDAGAAFGQDEETIYHIGLILMIQDGSDGERWRDKLLNVDRAEILGRGAKWLKRNGPTVAQMFGAAQVVEAAVLGGMGGSLLMIVGFLFGFGILAVTLGWHWGISQVLFWLLAAATSGWLFWLNGARVRMGLPMSVLRTTDEPVATSSRYQQFMGNLMVNPGRANAYRRFFGTVGVGPLAFGLLWAIVMVVEIMASNGVLASLSALMCVSMASLIFVVLSLLDRLSDLSKHIAHAVASWLPDWLADKELTARIKDIGSQETVWFRDFAARIATAYALSAVLGSFISLVMGRPDPLGSTPEARIANAVLQTVTLTITSFLAVSLGKTLIDLGRKTTNKALIKPNLDALADADTEKLYKAALYSRRVVTPALALVMPLVYWGLDGQGVLPWFLDTRIYNGPAIAVSHTIDRAFVAGEVNPTTFSSSCDATTQGKIEARFMTPLYKDGCDVQTSYCKRAWKTWPECHAELARANVIAGGKRPLPFPEW